MSRSRAQTRARTRTAARAGLAVVMMAATATTLAPTTSASAATRTDYVLWSAASAISVDAGLPDPGLPPELGKYLAHGEVASSAVRLDTASLGDVVSTARASGMSVDAPARPAGPDEEQLAHAVFSLADHHSPSTEPADVGTVDGPVTAAGLLTASALQSDADSTTGPTADSAATVAAAQLLPGSEVGGVPRPPLSAEVLSSSASGSRTGDDGSTSAVGNVATVTVEAVPGLVITAQLPKGEATGALADGVPSVATSCTFVEVEIAGTAPLPTEITSCTPRTVTIPPVGPPLVTVEIADRTPLTVPDGVGESISAVTITVHPLPLSDAPATVVRLGNATAVASTTTTTTPDPVRCPGVGAPGVQTGSGEAEGTVATLLVGPSLSRADLSRSRAAIDTERLPFVDHDTPLGPSRARASGQPLALGALPAPSGPPLSDPSVALTVTDSLAADEPRPEQSTAESAELLAGDLSTPLPVTDGALGLAASALSSTAEAAKGAPAASASSAAARLSGSLGLTEASDPVPVSASSVTSKASSVRGAGGAVTSSAEEILAQGDATAQPGATFNLVGAAVSVDVLTTGSDADGDADTSATANGVPGGAAATPGDVRILNLTVNGEVVPIDVDAEGRVLLSGSGTTTTVGDIEVVIGKVTQSAAADGSAASVEVIPVQITVPDVAVLTLGRTYASAAASPPAPTSSDLTVVTLLDGNFDRASFDDPTDSVISPHQKFWYRICVQNTGDVTRSGLTLVLPLSSHLKVIDPQGFTVVGTTASQAVPTLAPGALAIFDIMPEVNPSTPVPTSVQLTPVLSGAPGAAVAVTGRTFVADYTTAHPALRVVGVSQSYNSSTQVMTFVRKVVNHPSAGVAHGVFVDQIDINGPHTIVSGAAPNYPCGTAVCTLAPGESRQFTFQAKISQVTPSIRLHYRERATNAAGASYAFD